MASTAPRKSLARKGPVKTIGVVEAKKKVLEQIANGATRDEAMASVSRSVETYRDWMKNDPEFKRSIESLRTAQSTAKDLGTEPVPDFETFCRRYLKNPLFPHQLRGYDILEGRDPRDLHPSMTYEKGDPSRCLFNFPPNHAKTTSLVMDYATYRIHKDPNIKIAIISKSQGYAKKILAGIKMRLTSNAYGEMHRKFAPNGGWKDPDQSWNQVMIYVQGKGDGEKDPTVEAVGLGGSIYGGRFDLIICDDVIDNENAHRYEEQFDWLMTILDSRLPPEGGQLLVVGTRIAPNDLYSELRKAKDDEDNQFFTYLAQPAILDHGDGSRDTWLPLWPWTDWRGNPEVAHEPRCIRCYNTPDDCPCETPDILECQRRWKPRELAKKMAALGMRRWSLFWMQEGIPGDATFNQRAVECAVNRMRKAGPMTNEGVGHREGGRNGLYVVGGLDPATVGHTAMIVSGLDRARGKRWVMDGFNKAGISPATLRENVKRLTDLHQINEWVIERNAFQRFLTQDKELLDFLRSRGCRLTEHFTGSEKRDPDFGVMGMAPLFESCGIPPSNGGDGLWTPTRQTALIELPDSNHSAWCGDLVKQLVMWEPQGMTRSQKTDLVMALWFTEIAFQRILGYGKNKTTHVTNKFASRAAVRGRYTVNLIDLRNEQQAEPA